MAEPCRNCPALIEPVGKTGLWEDKNGITQCLKAPLGAKPGERVMHQPMPDVKERARELAASALACARRGDWQAASERVQQLGNECGPDGTLFAVIGWCDTLAAKQGIDENSGPLALGWRDEATGKVHAGTEGVPDRIRWAGQLIVARAALDEEMFFALIKALPKDKKIVGDHVGAVLETVAITMNGQEG